MARIAVVYWSGTGHTEAMAEAVAAGRALLDGQGCHYVVTPNPELVNTARADPAFREALNGADLVLPDGIGVVYAAKILGRPLKGRCPGIDFAAGLMAEMAREGRRLYLLGAKPGVAQAAARNLEAKYPGLNICGVHDGYFQDDGPVVEDIRSAAADAVFVCLGAPKQEKFIADNMDDIHSTLFCGLGGSLDVFAGVAQRAPEFYCKHNLEWFYRLIKTPSRAGRMMKLPLFLVHVAGEKRK